MKIIISFFTKTTNLWRGLAAIFIVVAIIVGVLIAATTPYIGKINKALGLRGSELRKTGISIEDTQYFKSEFAADINNPTMAELALLKAAGDAFVEEELEEGAVLLMNKNSALPLKTNERDISLFGHATVNPAYKSYSGGGYMDTSRVVNVKKAFTEEGFNINNTLWNAYEDRNNSGGINRRTGWYYNGSSWSQHNHSNTHYTLGDPRDEAFFTGVESSYASAYNDVAIAMVARAGGEFRDLPTGKNGVIRDDEHPNSSHLILHDSEKLMLRKMRDANFTKRILLVNSPFAMELHEVEQYNVDAILWIGGPGLTGLRGVVDLLIGNSNPSGRMVDTLAVDSLSSPAVQNFGSFFWTNRDSVYNALKDEDGAEGSATGQAQNNRYVQNYLVYQEGIYIGYKYYETRYEDSVLNRNNAKSTAGKSEVYTYSGDWDYTKEVQYPFGYGISYTNFTQSIEGTPAYSAANDEFTINVKVKNTGTVEGKFSVPLYVQVPYTGYNSENKIEKSAIQLCGFDKTKLLKAGEEETLSIKVDRYLLASYNNAIDKQCWFLDKGNYYFAVGNDIHDALNHIISTKASGNDLGGATLGTLYNTDKTVYNSANIAGKVWKYTLNDNVNYKYGENNYEIKNRFDFMDINQWANVNQQKDYLSRSDWKATYPTPRVLTANSSMIEALDGDFYVKPSDAPAVDSFKVGSESDAIEIKFVDMRDVEYDDQLWDDFLDQLTIDEMCFILNDQCEQGPLPRVVKPEQINQDGPDGVQGAYQIKDSTGAYKSQGDCTAYANEVVSASTFNPDMLLRKGELMGEDALFAKVHQLWSPGADMHRTPFGGRNFEYYSECSLLSYLCLSIQVPGMQAKGLQSAPKHFAGNDQEEHRRGVSTFMTEQTFREFGLRGFEGAFTKGGAMGTMTAYNRLGMKYAGASHEMQEEVLRGEWGFEGVVITDCASNGSASGGKNSQLAYIHTIESLVNGTDMFCMQWGESRSDEVKEAIDGGDGYILQKLRDANHHFYYAFTRTNLINGLDSDTIVVPIINWWQNALNISFITSLIIGIVTALLHLTGSGIIIVKKFSKKTSVPLTN